MGRIFSCKNSCNWMWTYTKRCKNSRVCECQWQSLVMIYINYISVLAAGNIFYLGRISVTKAAIIWLKFPCLQELGCKSPCQGKKEIDSVSLTICDKASWFCYLWFLILNGICSFSLMTVKSLGTFKLIDNVKEKSMSFTRNALILAYQVNSFSCFLYFSNLVVT